MFGFELALQQTMELQPGKFQKIAFIKYGDFYLELYESPNGEPFDFHKGRIGCQHICFYASREEFPLVENHLREQKAAFVINESHPEDVCGKPGGCRVIYVLDPDGIAVEIIEDYKPGEY
jgi:catechol 2,3-dioxygenase-like lactoylglutathione lyase family enzyme